MQITGGSKKHPAEQRRFLCRESPFLLPIEAVADQTTEEYPSSWDSKILNPKVFQRKDWKIDIEKSVVFFAPFWVKSTFY